MLVFVYGTLLRGFFNHEYLLADCPFLGEDATAPEYTLVSLGRFPAALAGGETAVQGEVYDVDEYTFRLLDQLEGYPFFYSRAEVQLQSGRQAWMYFLVTEALPNGTYPAIPSGSWRGYVQRGKGKGDE